MKRKSKLFFSMLSLCFSIAMLCFGVYSAISVTYSITGSVNYEVKDAFVQIETKVYPIDTENNLTDDVALEAILTELDLPNLSFEQIVQIFASLGISITPSQEFAPYNSLTNTGTSSASGINIDYNQQYLYMIVVNVKNLSDANYVHASLVASLENQDVNSYIVKSDNISNLSSTTNNSNGQNIILFYALKDATVSLNDIGFNYSLNITCSSETQIELTPLEYFDFTPINNNTEYEVSLNSSLTTKASRTFDVLTIPAEYQGLPVTRIADGVAKEEATIELNNISKWVQYITATGDTELEGVNSFMGIDATTVLIPSSIKDIGYAAFAGAIFDNIVFNEGLENIYDSAFCFAANHGVLENNISTMTLDLPNSLQTIGDGAFYLFGTSMDVYIGENTYSIKDNNFYASFIFVVATTYDIKVNENNNYYTSIDNGMEMHCLVEKSTGTLMVGSQLCSEIPSFVTSINNYAFADSEQQNLSLTIPANVELESWEVFAGADFDTIIIEEGVSIGEMLSSDMELTLNTLVIKGVAQFTNVPICRFDSIVNGVDIGTIKFEVVEGNETLIDNFIEALVAGSGDAYYAIGAIEVPTQEDADTLNAQYTAYPIFVAANA